MLVYHIILKLSRFDWVDLAYRAFDANYILGLNRLAYMYF